MRRFLLGIGLCGTVFSAALSAQELTWTDLETLGTHPVAATQLKMTGRHVPPVPPEMAKLSDMAYGEVDSVTDGKGTGVARSTRATSPWLVAAIAEGFMGVRIVPTPGREKDAPFLTSRCYLIFNPAASVRRGPDKAPRVIQVRSAVYPSAVLAGFRKRKISDEDLPKIALADVTVDESGGVRDVGVPEFDGAPGLADAVKSAVQNWRFEPARHDGMAVAANVRVPVLLDLPFFFDVSELTKPPRAIRQQKPVYPFSERRDGFVGQVTVQFIVTKEGDVRDAFVKQSNNPNFNEPAVTAVSQWKFEPGMRNGKPVNTVMSVPMVFSLNGIPAYDRYEVSNRRPDKLPEELKNDYPPRVKNVAAGVYPFEQLEKDVRMTVTEKFAVSPEGRVNFFDTPDQKLTDFDYAARAMLEEFEFVPASKNGKPNWGLLKMDVSFSSNSDQVKVSSSARHILRELRKNEPEIYQANQIDQKLERTISHQTPFPSNLLNARKDGEALIEFFVDEEGQAQLPRIVSASHPSFGYAGAQAVSQWRFKPVTHAGKPCIVRVRVPMKFTAVSMEPEAKNATAPSGS